MNGPANSPPDASPRASCTHEMAAYYLTRHPRPGTPLSGMPVIRRAARPALPGHREGRAAQLPVWCGVLALAAALAQTLASSVTSPTGTRSSLTPNGWASAARVSAVGLAWPRSIRLISACATPEADASCCWVRPAANRCCRTRPDLEARAGSV